MKIFSFLSILTLLFAACEGTTNVDELANLGECNELIVDREAYQNEESASYMIDTAFIAQDCLNIVFGSSGCSGSTWETSMIDSEQIMESYPIQRALRMVLKNQEMCQAYFIDTATFNLTKIRTEDPSILLNINGYDHKLLYSYEYDKDDIKGTWHLANISGGFGGLNQDIERGNEVWTINNESVSVKIESKDWSSGLENGSYPIKVERIDNYFQLSLDNKAYSIWSIKVNEFIIADAEITDGFTYKFVR